MELAQISNLATVIFTSIGIGVCFLCLLQIPKSHFSKEGKTFFRNFFGLVLTYLVMHMTRETLQMFAVANATGILIAIRIVTFVEFFTSGAMAICISLLILHASRPHYERIEKNLKKYTAVLTVLFAVHVIMLVVAAFTNLYYHFDLTETVSRSSVVYARSPLYFLSNIPQLLMLGLDLYLLLRYGKKLDPRLNKAFWFYIALPVAGALIQLFFQQFQLVIFATVISTVNMFYVILRIQNELYQKQEIESSRLESELSMATRIQADMVPNIFPPYPDRKEFDIYASMDPAKEVGGDFYDFFLIDDHHLGLVMADVSGKGVPAALFMMISKIIIQNFALSDRDPKVALESANDQICRNNREEMFVTVWLGILDLETGLLTASNAGHEYPALKMPGKPFELYHDRHGFVIGGMEGSRYRNYEIRLEKGSKLFVYTDGVPEATNASGELFGPERLVDALNTAADGQPQQILKAVDGAISGFVGKAPQFDDITMMCVVYYGPEEEKEEG